MAPKMRSAPASSSSAVGANLQFSERTSIWEEVLKVFLKSERNSRFYPSFNLLRDKKTPGISKEYLQRISINRKRNRNILRWEMLAQVLREVYANNQFLLFRRLTPAQYFPSRHAGTPRITSCLRRNFRRNVHGFQSGNRYKHQQNI